VVPQLAEREQGATSWADLDSVAKRRRLLDAATTVFAERGLDAPMPAIAQAVGIGVGSLYRRYPSKEVLIGDLVTEQMHVVRAELQAVREQPDAGAALEETLRRLVEWQTRNHLVRAALAATSERLEVQAAVAEVSLEWQKLLDRARKQGRVRVDVTVSDLRLVFAAARAADEVEPGSRERMLELLLDALLVKR
jgi:AcrR family transcriptional regulator